MNILLADKPSPPNGPLKVSDVYAEGCKLSWKPPDDDGGQPVEKYVVEKMDEATGMLISFCFVILLDNIGSIVKYVILIFKSKKKILTWYLISYSAPTEIYLSSSAFIYKVSLDIFTFGYGALRFLFLMVYCFIYFTLNRFVYFHF